MLELNRPTLFQIRIVILRLSSQGIVFLNFKFFTIYFKANISILFMSFEILLGYLREKFLELLSLKKTLFFIFLSSNLPKDEDLNSFEYEKKFCRVHEGP